MAAGTDNLVFVAGIVKGLVEKNDWAHHFGSLGAVSTHLSHAASLGLITYVPHPGHIYQEEVTITELGLEWYHKQRLSEYSDGRAYFWNFILREE